jgi:NADH:ubiquinone reductase (H+-translocating)
VPKIVIAGGGFAGTYAAMYLDRALACRPDVEVVLISRDNFVLFTPLLHEVAAGDLDPADIVNPLRRMLRHVQVVEADVEGIDLDARRVRCGVGLPDRVREFGYDHLLLALGSETNFFDMPGLRDWAVTLKDLTDAMMLRDRMVALLEQAALEPDPAVRERLLTFVTAGGGFAGVEVTGAVNDFVRETIRFYPSLAPEMIRILVVHPGACLLPELGEPLGRYAERKLRGRQVEVIKGARVAGYDGSTVRLSDGRGIATSTLIWTAGIKPSPVLATLSVEKQRGCVLVDEHLQVPGLSGVWAAGDCAAVPNAQTGRPYPATAQHGLREGLAAAKNIERAILDRPLRSFRYQTMGQLASIGHHTGVARVFGLNFSGWVAWWFWRTLYLAKLPGVVKKLRVMVAWTLDLFCGREIEQMLSLREMKLLADGLSAVSADGGLATAGGSQDAGGVLSHAGQASADLV